MDSGKLPKVSLAALGGTITMTAESGQRGVTPTLTAERLVAEVPDLAEIAELSTTTLSKTPGASLTSEDVLQATNWGAEQASQGADGVVLAQGTDTLEETAFLASLYWDQEQPLIFTGAMRSPNQPSSDTAANLIASCRVAAAEDFRGSGTLVVLNNEIHSAALVRKEHSTSLDSFRSSQGRLTGALIEGHAYQYRRPARHPRVGQPITNPNVPLLETHLDDQGHALRTMCEAGADGIVLAAFGVGHVSMQLADEIERVAKRIPVIISSRTSDGGTLCNTYGFEGSETDLLTRGAILSGRLDHRKSRILLWVLLASGLSMARTRDSFLRIANMTH